MTDPITPVPALPVYLYLGLIVLAGYAVVGCVGDRRRHWAEQLGLSFAAGLAVIAFVLFWASIAEFVPSRATLIAIAVVSGSAVVMHIFRRGRELVPTTPSPSANDRFTPLGVIGLIAIVIAAATVDARSHWAGFRDIDAFAIWLFKAKALALQPLRPLPAALISPNLSYSHQDYPLGFPLAVAGLYTATGRIDPAVADALLLPIYLAVIAVAYGGLRRFHRRATALPLTAIFVAAPTLTINACNGVAETLLILNLTAALVLAVRWIEGSEWSDGTRPRLLEHSVSHGLRPGRPGQRPGLTEIDQHHRSDAMLAGFFAAAAAFSKNEGLALLPVLAIGLGFVAVARRSRTRIFDWLAFVVTAAVLIGPWVWFRHGLPKTHEDYGSRLMSPEQIASHAKRIWPTIKVMAGYAFWPPTAGLIWYLLAGTAALGWRVFRGPAVVFLGFVLVCQLLLYLGTLVVTPWDPAVLIPMITPKLLTQATPAAVLVIGLSLREIGWGRARPKPPSPGTPGEGRGEGDSGAESLGNSKRPSP
jgi:hypothetical protein